MSARNQTIFSGWARFLVVSLSVLSQCAGSLLGKTSSSPPAFYALDGVPAGTSQWVPGAAPGSKLWVGVALLEPGRARTVDLGHDSKGLGWGRWSAPGQRAIRLPASSDSTISTRRFS